MPPAPTTHPEEGGRPPQPPEIERRLALPPQQAIYLSFLALFVALAVFGVFGDTQATERASGPGLGLEVEYPSRFRYRAHAPLQVTVHNTSGQRLDTVRVRFNEDYVERFSNVRFTPSAQEAWVVVLTGIEPGGWHLISGELQAERYGRHAGTVTVTAPGLHPVALELSTLTLP